MTHLEIHNLVTKWEAAMASDPNQFPMTDSHREIIKSYLEMLSTLDASAQKKPWYAVFHSHGERDEKRLRKIKNTEGLLRAWSHR